MTLREKWIPSKKANPDWILLLVVVVLIIFGFVNLFSASYGYGLTKFGNGYYYIQQQLRGLAVGVVLMFFAYRIDYAQLNQRKTLIAMYIISIVLLICCFIPGIGTTDGINAARRWLRVPVFGSFQPSELAKFVLLIVEAGILSRMKPNAMKTSWVAAFSPMLIAIPFVFLMYKQPNFSILMITMISFMVVLFTAGLTWRQIVMIFAFGLVVAFLAAWQAEYRQDRITSFRNPFDKANINTGSQLRDSLYALGSGGLTGTGLGRSRMKYDFLSYGESDFILSIIGEELGLRGLLVLMIVYVLLLWRGYTIAMGATNRFAAFTATGITTLIGMQTFLHVLVGIGLVPTTGVTLPFVSHGSSSLMCFMGAVGLLLGISCEQREKVKVKAEKTSTAYAAQ